MNGTKPSSVTLEEAVARMVNMDYIPAGFSPLDMTAAFQEESEVEYENAKLDRLPEEQLNNLKVRMEACSVRHSLAELMLESLKREINNPDGSRIILADDSSSQPRLTLESVSEWVADQYGIGIPEWSSVAPVTDAAGKLVRWEDVTIKIYADYRIGYNLGDGKWLSSSFQMIGLMGKRKLEPNILGGILIGLSQGKQFLPSGQYVENKNAAAISKLRNALKELTGLAEDPFLPFNSADGWKTRFKLIDDRRNADERAKKRATTVSYDDTRNFSPPEARDFDDEGDDTQTWIDENS
jgi:hypothetical protein